MDKKAGELTQAQQLQGLNRYLAAGQGRGRLISAATVYNGQVGYFFVSHVEVEGVKQECILFSGLGGEDIVITAFPLQPKAARMTGDEAKKLFKEACLAYPTLP